MVKLPNLYQQNIYQQLKEKDLRYLEIVAKFNYRTPLKIYKKLQSLLKMIKLLTIRFVQIFST